MTFNRDCMYGIDNQQKIPAAYLEDHEAWDNHVGHLWYNLLYFLDFSPQSTVIELAPGNSQKVGSALARFGFSGDLYIVDASADVIARLKPRYESLLPRARLHWIAATLEKSLNDLPRGADFFLASHVIDDFLLGAAGETLAWASSYTHEPETGLKETWARLQKNPERLATLRKAVRADLVQAMRALQPRHSVFSQYPSSALYDHGLAALNDNAAKVLAALKNDFAGDMVEEKFVQMVLNSGKNFNNAHMGEHVLNAGYWMLCKHAQY